MTYVETDTCHSLNAMNALFAPQTIAVIGASRRPEAVGYAILHNLIQGGYKGKIYPVNPKADSICDIPCHASVADLPDDVDLAVLIVPNTATPETLRQCAQKKIKAAIIISAGFKEIGGDGIRLEKEIAAIARESGMPVLGPNCLGLINTDPAFSMNASFSRTMPIKGNIAFISQSGALCTAILDYAKGQNIGFSKFLSLGNKAVLTELDFLRYLKDDPETDVIMMYVEDIADSREFIDLAAEITGEQKHKKPILVIKSGRTPEGAKAAQSHTGSLMGSDEVYDAIFAQAGVLRLNSVQDMFDVGIALSSQPIPKTNRVAIVTNAGGPGIMATDACIRYGMELAKFEPQTIEVLKKALPITANVSNPVDVIGDAQHGRYEEALKAIAADPNVDSILVILTPQAMTDIEDTARVVVKIDQEISTPLLACFMGITDVYPGVKILEENYVPHYRFPESAARTLGTMVRYQKWIQRPRTQVRTFPANREHAAEILKQCADKKLTMLPIHRAMEILEDYGFPLLPYGFADHADHAVAVAHKIGFPVAMKIVSEDIVHKFDVGAVKLNIYTPEKVAETFYNMMQNARTKMPDARLDGIMIQGMGQKGCEVILGMHRHPNLGPVLMFGLGGVYVETLKDVTFRLAPIKELSARRMIESIRAYPLLTGVRGGEPSDKTAIIQCLQRLSQLACEQPLIKEIDINPLIVYPEKQGAFVLDARIIL